MKTRFASQRYLNSFILLILVSLLGACGTPEVDIKQTPTPGQTAPATVAALATEKAPVATQVPTLTIHTPTPSDLDRARKALITFFSLLHDQRYSEAVSYYGGTYEILRYWNPLVAENDYAALLKNGCTVNGLMCLRVRTIVSEEQVSPIEFKFVVEFMDDDGTLFVFGPCCGATVTEMPPKWQFVYTVKKVGDRFLVQGLPIYVP